MLPEDFNDAIAAMPLIVALRGIQESEVSDVGTVLIESGITVLEVTVRTKNAALSSVDENAIRSLNKLLELHGESVNVVAGTVMQVEDLSTLKRMGVKICLSPNFNPNVVREADRLGISFIPGVETISEAMSAIALGAKGLKLFPSFYYEPDGSVTLRHTPGFVKYLAKFVSCPIIMSGDVSSNDLPVSYLTAGAAAINIGSHFYQSDIDIRELETRAKCFIAAIKSVN